MLCSIFSTKFGVAKGVILRHFSHKKREILAKISFKTAKKPCEILLNPKATLRFCFQIESAVFGR